MDPNKLLEDGLTWPEAFVFTVEALLVGFVIWVMFRFFFRD